MTETEAGAEPILDLAQLSMMTGGDSSLAVEVIDIFRQQTEIWLSLLDPALPKEQWADAAHSLKGSALSVGANRLAQSCAQAETLGRSEGEVSIVQAGTAIAGVKDQVGPAIEAAAKVAHRLSVSGTFPASI